MTDSSTQDGKREQTPADAADQNTAQEQTPATDNGVEATAGAGGASGQPPAAASDGGGGRDRRGRSMGVAVAALIIALFVAVVGAAGGWWLWERFQVLDDAADTYAGQDDIQALQERLDNRDERLTGRVDNLSEEHSNHVRALARAEETMERVREERAQAQERMDRIEELAAAHRNEWILAEAGYLYGVARYRTHFHSDVDGALQALREADALLEELGGATVDQRQAVAEAINALLDVRQPDRAGMAADISALIQAVGEWPLQEFDRQVEPAEIPRDRDAQLDTLDGWREAGERAWSQFRDTIGSLVVVRRDDAPPRLMAPEESHYLRENARLQLLTARIALLEGEVSVFRDSLAEVDAWLELHFDGDDDGVRDARDTIASLRDKEIRAEMPDLDDILPDRQAPGRDVREDDE